MQTDKTNTTTNVDLTLSVWILSNVKNIHSCLPSIVAWLLLIRQIIWRKGTDLIYVNEDTFTFL